MKHFLLRGLQQAFSWERVAVRALAAWFSFAALVLLRTGAGFAEIGYAFEGSLLKLLLPILLFFVAFSAVAVLLQLVHVDSWLLLFAETVCVFRWLSEFEHSTDEFLFLLAVLAVYALTVIGFLRANEELFAGFDPGRGWVAALIALAAIFGCAVVATITCLRYKTFASPNFDFGLFCNMFYNMKETGQPLITSERDGLLSHFAVHISPVFYLLLPFYWLFPCPETLQIGQAAVLFAGVIPVALLARHFGLSRRTAAAVSLLYCFYPVLSTGCFYDIHENCFLTVFLLFTFYFYEKKKYLPMYLSVLFVLGVKEDAAIYLLLFALFVLISEKRFWQGASLAAMSVAYFGVAYFLLQKYGTGVLSNRFDNLIYDGEAGIFGILNLALTNPGYLLSQLFTAADGGWSKAVYFLQLLLPLGFLPFCTKKTSRWLLLAPMLINLLSHYRYLCDIGFQYSFAIIAFLFYALLKNLPEMTHPTRRDLLGFAAAAACCFYLVTVVPQLQYYTQRWESNKDTYRQMEAILDTIPDDASVNCSSFLLAHLYERDEIYEVNYHGNKPDVDYVVLDARYNEHKRAMYAYLAQDYTLLTEEEGLIVILISPDCPVG